MHLQAVTLDTKKMDILRDQEIQQAVDRIAQALSPSRIILFGSHAYGNPTSESDVDLLIIMPTDERPVRRSIAVSRLFQKRPFPMDILVRTPQEIQERLDIGDSFFQEILNRGKVLYEK